MFLSSLYFAVLNLADHGHVLYSPQTFSVTAAVVTPAVNDLLKLPSVLPKNTTQPPRPGLEPGPLDPETSAPTNEATSPTGWGEEALVPSSHILSTKRLRSVALYCSRICEINACCIGLEHEHKINRKK